jgi:hypothetical protein
MDHFIKLDKLPEGLKFPHDLMDRIYFDAEQGKLVFRGTMSKHDFDRLSQLTNDWGFRRRLEDLFRASVEEPKQKTGGFRQMSAAFARLFSLG